MARTLQELAKSHVPGEKEIDSITGNRSVRNDRNIHSFVGHQQERFPADPSRRRTINLEGSRGRISNQTNSKNTAGVVRGQRGASRGLNSWWASGGWSELKHIHHILCSSRRRLRLDRKLPKSHAIRRSVSIAENRRILGRVRWCD